MAMFNSYVSLPEGILHFQRHRDDLQEAAKQQPESLKADLKHLGEEFSGPWGKSVWFQVLQQEELL
jgi:hypothetical protein